jgi:hypothetical protein
VDYSNYNSSTEPDFLNVAGIIFVYRSYNCCDAKDSPCSLPCSGNGEWPHDDNHSAGLPTAKFQDN